MPQQKEERNIVLALQAIQNDPTLSARAVGKIYTISHEKLSRRRRGTQPRRDIPANSRKLTDLEELVVFQHILDLDSKGFPPGYLLKIWQIHFLQHAICHALGRVRLLTLLSAAQSSGHASSENTTARELSAKIQKSFVAGLSL